MFGYVRVCKPELKVREYEAYKAVYCTLCKTIGKTYGVFARGLLSYDATFYVLLRACALSETEPAYQKGRCPFNLAKVCNYQTNGAEIYADAAALTVILAYHKVRDNLQDGEFWKKLAAAALYPLLRASYKKAKRLYPQFAEIAADAMQKQNRLEAAKCVSTDEAAHPSAEALADLFTVDMPQGVQKRVTARIAYCIGRWVYLMDAYDDLRADLKSGSYNVFLQKYAITNETELSGKDVQRDILRSLHMSENEAAASLALLQGSTHRAVLENILCDGLAAKTAAVQKQFEEVSPQNV